MPWFEDFAVGDRVAFGRYEVTREEVLAFAGAYDPQPFHLDDTAAAKTHFKKIAASGWHTCAMTMAMVVARQKEVDAHEENDSGGLGALGIDSLRWVRPVYPGDVLRCETEVLEIKPSRSQPHMGSVRSRITVFNQDDQPVLTQEPIALFRRRSENGQTGAGDPTS